MSVKFRNSKTGEVFEDLGAARFAFCNQKCRECPISCFKNDDGTRCDAYCVHHAWKAAKLMGYEVVEDSKEVEIDPVEKENSMTRKEILAAAEACVCGQREEDYGSPEDNFRTIAELWQAYIKACCVGPGVHVDMCPEDVASLMALMKIARIASGCGKNDCWIDLAGYAACGGELAGGAK